MSCDASCAPTGHSPDIDLIPEDDRFDSGFHADIPQPSKMSSALLVVMHEALAAKAKANQDIASFDQFSEIANLIKLAHGMK